MIITVFKNGVGKDYKLEPIVGGFRHVGALPLPCLGQKYLYAGVEIDLVELGMKVEDNQQIYYYDYRISEQGSGA
jgi:hypothetical protein